MTDNVKAIAHLSNGGTVEITLPLSFDVADDYPATWHTDQNGVLLNMQHVQAITFAPAEPTWVRKLVAVIDSEGDRWESEEDGFHLISKSSGRRLNIAWSRSDIEEYYGPVREVWE